MTVPTVEVITVVSRIIWKLRETLARRRVTNKALADEIGLHPTNVSRLKNRDTLPAIGSDDIERIRVAITKLSSEEFGVCTLSELVELKEDSE
ncbi:MULTISPECIES: helix-turn-helix domain-containing protein [Leptolyngbya]|uniref:helix-turn-helix domain-containing protein n=1 Tax=Leptolyngbya TaxID=47251 RepID=UPI0016854408|nr:helix-turn-helix domain-containing protein [Leptolyngbya sp. FACHB-1624]MBD1857707.1 helix-turn-helix domain-containing protein [Leptolyngbya sp. FACHB-1624]